MPTVLTEQVCQEAVAAYLDQAGTLKEVAVRYGMSASRLSRLVLRHRFTHRLPRKRRQRAGAPLPSEAKEPPQEPVHAPSPPYAPAASGRPLPAEPGAQAVAGEAVSPPSPPRKRRRTRPAPKALPALPPEPQAQADPKPVPHRYTKAHRRDEPGRYPTDLTDAQWQLLEAHFAARGGRPPEHTPRVMLNAIFYVLRSGCPWRMLPHDFPPWKTVYTAFRRWMKDGRLRRAHDALRRTLRVRLGRKEDPTALIVDSQSVKTTEKGGLAVTTRARRSTGESDTLPSTPSGS